MGNANSVLRLGLRSWILMTNPPTGGSGPQKGEPMDWKKYVREQAEEFGVPFPDAWLLFELLGPNEAYDGFITELEDMSQCFNDL